MKVKNYILSGLMMFSVAGCGVGNPYQFETSQEGKVERVAHNGKGLFPIPEGKSRGIMPVGSDFFPSVRRIGTGWGIFHDYNLDGFADRIEEIDGSSSADLYNAEREARRLDLSGVENYESLRESRE